MPLPPRSRPVPGRRFSAAARVWPPTALACLLAAPLIVGAARLALHPFFPAASAAFPAFGALSAQGLRAGGFWELITHLLLPPDGAAIWTLPAALLLLYLAGRPLEMLLGARRLLTLYALSGVVGGLGQVGFDLLRGSGVNPDTAPFCGATAPAVAVVLAAACLLPAAAPTPWRPVRVRHLAFFTLALLGVALLAGDATVRRVAGPQLARALLGGLVGCVYARGLLASGFYLRRPLPASFLPPPDSVSAAPSPNAAVPSPPAFIPHPSSLIPSSPPPARRLSSREYVAEQIDPILEKIHRHGLASLTPDERRRLEEAREKLAGQGG